jgi:hypothetical protein
MRAHPPLRFLVALVVLGVAEATRTRLAVGVAFQIAGRDAGDRPPSAAGVGSRVYAIFLPRVRRNVIGSWSAQ